MSPDIRVTSEMCWKQRLVPQAIRPFGSRLQWQAKKKGFLYDADVKRERVAFAQAAKLWTRERPYLLMFSDEVWTKGGGFTFKWITKLVDGSKNYTEGV